MAVNSIYVENYVDSVPTNATTVVLQDNTGTYGIRKLSDQSILVAAGEPTVNDAVGVYSYSGASGISNIPGYDPTEVYEYEWQITQVTGDIEYVHGHIEEQPVTTEFLDAITQVQEWTDLLLGDSETRELLNQSLRIVANHRPWDWTEESTEYVLNTAALVPEYTLPTSIKEIIGAYSEFFARFKIFDSRNFSAFDMGRDNYIGVPFAMLLINGGVRLYPTPSSDDVVNILYKQTFKLVEDNDTFPCGDDFTDAIIARASWKGAMRKGKLEIAKAFQEDYKEMLQSLQSAAQGRDHFHFGDVLYASSHYPWYSSRRYRT